MDSKAWQLLFALLVYLSVQLAEIWWEIKKKEKEEMGEQEDNERIGK